MTAPTQTQLPLLRATACSPYGRTGHLTWLFCLSIVLLTNLSAHSAPPLAIDFAGIPQTSYSPSDASIAAGPSNLVVVASSMIGIYTKSGGNILIEPLTSWFASANPPGPPLEPKVVYDAKAGHWIILALANGSSQRSSYMISVSSN